MVFSGLPEFLNVNMTLGVGGSSVKALVKHVSRGSICPSMCVDTHALYCSV